MTIWQFLFAFWFNSQLGWALLVSIGIVLKDGFWQAIIIIVRDY